MIDAVGRVPDLSPVSPPVFPMAFLEDIFPKVNLRDINNFTMSTTFPVYPDPYVGEIRLFAASSINQEIGWALCDGRLLNIENYPELFSLIGTTYGGDGVKTFAIPNLQGRVPVLKGDNLPVGTIGGVEMVILSQDELPTHTHTVSSSKSEPLESPAGNFWGISSSNPYAPPPGTTSLNPASIATYGLGYGHENRIPYQVVNFVMALNGKYPSPD